MILDWIFLILIALAFFRGFRKGLLYTLFSFVSIFAGVWVASRFSNFAAGVLLVNKPELGKWASLIAYILVFVLAVWLIRIMARVFQHILKASFLGVFNKLLGGLLGVLIVSLVYSILIWFLFSFKLISEETLQSSVVAEYLYPYATKVFDLYRIVTPK